MVGRNSHEGIEQSSREEGSRFGGREEKAHFDEEEVRGRSPILLDGIDALVRLRRDLINERTTSETRGKS